MKSLTAAFNLWTSVAVAGVISSFGFNSVRGMCMILVLGLVTFYADKAMAQATSIPVGNFSFETEGGDPGHADWRMLPGTSWVDGNATNAYEILELDVEGTHFKNFIGPDWDNRPGPGGVNVLNLAAAATAATAMTQDLGYAIGSGDLVSVSCVLGDSGIQTPGDVEVSILVDGSPDASVTVTNNADDGDFKAFKSVLTATGSGNLSIGFKNKTNNNWLDLIDVAVVPAAAAAAGQIPVGNFSFETEGTAYQDGWYHLPGIGSWDKADSSEYQILDLSLETTNFPGLDVGPEGVNVLNLATAGTISQDVGYDVLSGDEVVLDFSLGDSAKAGQNPGNVSVSILIDGIVRARKSIANTAADGAFTNIQSSFTATADGSLSIRFQNSGGNNWLDNVNVKITSPASAAPAVQGAVDVTGWSSGFHHGEGWTEANAWGSGGVNNSLGETDSNSYGPPPYLPGFISSNQNYTVTWADGEAVSDRGTYFGAWNQYRDGKASADLYLDLTGAAEDSSAEGLTSAGFGGVTYDGSDGSEDLQINFTVNFTINASAADSNVDGLFGIHVDARRYGAGDLVTNFTPHVIGSSLGDPGAELPMVFAEKTPGGGDYAWFFTCSAADIAAQGGSISDTLTAHFSFQATSVAPLYDGVDIVDITAFATAKAEVLPPATVLIVR
jgi:hypothetical protein